VVVPADRLKIFWSDSNKSKLQLQIDKQELTNIGKFLLQFSSNSRFFLCSLQKREDYHTLSPRHTNAQLNMGTACDAKFSFHKLVYSTADNLLFLMGPRLTNGALKHKAIPVTGLGGP
jgi:hypothetical protein